MWLSLEYNSRSKTSFTKLKEIHLIQLLKQATLPLHGCFWFAKAPEIVFRELLLMFLLSGDIFLEIDCQRLQSSLLVQEWWKSQLVLSKLELRHTYCSPCIKPCFVLFPPGTLVPNNHFTFAYMMQLLPIKAMRVLLFQWLSPVTVACLLYFLIALQWVLIF